MTTMISLLVDSPVTSGEWSDRGQLKVTDDGYY